MILEKQYEMSESGLRGLLDQILHKHEDPKPAAAVGQGTTTPVKKVKASKQ